MYGCCSSFKKCSEIGECVRPDPSDASECYYNVINLQRGLNFYSDSPKNTSTQTIIEVMGRAFKVLRNEKSLSYRLSESEASLLQSTFVLAGENSQCIKEETSKSDPAVCRIEFTYHGTRFNVLNYNGYLLTRRTCEDLKASLMSTYPDISAEIVTIGVVEKYSATPAAGNKPYNVSKQEKSSSDEPDNEQLSLF